MNEDISLYNIPNTLAEKYTKERIRLYKLLDVLNDAIIHLCSGNVSSYSLGNRSVSYQNINELKNIRHETEDRINEIESILRGASPRNVTTSVFLDPSIIVPRR